MKKQEHNLVNEAFKNQESEHIRIQAFKKEFRTKLKFLIDKKQMKTKRSH